MLFLQARAAAKKKQAAGKGGKKAAEDDADEEDFESEESEPPSDDPEDEVGETFVLLMNSRSHFLLNSLELIPTHYSFVCTLVNPGLPKHTRF